ncbi:hypothetical protein PPYR_01528 [Photinus pyralis]|uniref:Uncharacterized protein n=3 Tax=Photinus pyralis TaxID=7054 RepID=A0A5N4B4V0_PHOPY|nr:Bardet-Biedl syndrome 4 protein homolog isoform X1 [Photinus pyralis]KAB0804558.1 hypothetical protein PPYR_01528 [Photinus pyralis]
MSYVANGKQVTSVGKDKKMATATFDSNPLEQLNWLIHLYYVRGEIAKCKELIKRQIKMSSGKHEYAFFKQGVILREEDKIQEALESFQMCHKLNCDNADNIKEVAKCLYLLRKYRIALEAYLEAERISTKPDWEIYHNIGQCWVSLGENAKAKEYTKKAVQLGKQECSYTLLIKILISEGDLQTAINVSNAALESCPDSTSMLTQSGLLHLKLGQVQPAFQCLSSAVALNPSCSEALLGIGCITQAHEEYEVALSKYKIAVQINPDSIALWNNIGMCFFAKQKYVAAISCLKRALWISPLNWKVLLNLGLVHLSTSQPASAFNFLCAAVNLRPDAALPFLALGCALFELKDPENAVKAFQQAELLSKNDYNTMLNTVLALLTVGQYEQASTVLEKFKRVSEGDSQIDKQVTNLSNNLESALKKLMIRNELEELSESLVGDALVPNAKQEKDSEKSSEKAINETENLRKLESDEV